MDAALIGAAQRVEHYEIAAYGTVSEFAKVLGETEHVDLLNETLEEEKETDEKLTELSGDINVQANEDAEGEEDEDEEGDEEQMEDDEKSAPRVAKKSGRRVA